MRRRVYEDQKRDEEIAYVFKTEETNPSETTSLPPLPSEIHTDTIVHTLLSL